jgi:hypothetical protein
MATILAIVAAAGAVFVYMDGRHRRKKTDSRLWFWVNDLYTRQGVTPPKPPDLEDDSVFKSQVRTWERG